MIPNSLKIKVPAIAKLHNTTKQVKAARRVIRRLCSAPAAAVMMRKVGTAPIGSTRKNIEVSATNENCRSSVRGTNVRVLSAVPVDG